MRKKTPFIIQDRDLSILQGLFESRVMTTTHVATLYFDSRREATKKRLQILKGANLIADRPRKAFEAAVLILTRGGLAALKERGILRQYPMLSRSALERRAHVSDATLRHELEVMDAKAAIAYAAKAAAFSVLEFTTWPLLTQFTSAASVVKPDGFFRLGKLDLNGSGPENAFFLELDRSTESLDILIARARSYLEYFRSGGFAERNGAARGRFKEHPFRVLYVLKTAERRNNIAERLLLNNPPILSLVWLTTLRELIENPFGAIWVRPLEYRNAFDGTSFAQSRGTKAFGYRRQSARDRFAATNVCKRSLLDKTQ